MTYEEWLTVTADYSTQEHAECACDILASAYADGFTAEQARHLRWHSDAERGGGMTSEV